MSADYLYLHPAGLDVFHADRRTLTAGPRFSSDGAVSGAFEAYLRGSPDRVRHLVVDLVEEEFHAESLPPASGKDRRALLARRLGSLFRLTPYRHYCPLGRDASGRRDFQYLLSALTDPSRLEPWLDCMAHVGVPLEAVYSMPLLLAAMSAGCGTDGSPLTMLVTVGRAGMRQTVLTPQGLRFSRLLPPGATSWSMNALLGEARQTRQYLSSLRLLTPDQRLPITVVLPRVPPGGFELQAAGDLAVRQMGLAAWAKALGIPNLPATAEGPERAVLTWLIRHRHRNHYAPKASLREAVWRHAGRGVLAVSAGVLLVAAGVSAYLQWQTRALEAELRRLQPVSVQLENAYRQAVALDRQAGASPEQMRAAVEAAARLNHWPRPEEGLHELGALLKQIPALHLDELDWHVEPPSAAQAGATGAPARLTIDLTGTVGVAAGADRQATEAVEALRSSLLRITSSEVVVHRWPLDAPAAQESSKTPAGAGEYRFSLSWRRPMDTRLSGEGA